MASADGAEEGGHPRGGIMARYGHSALSGPVSVAAFTIFIQILSVSSGPVIARMLGPTERGQFAAAIGVSTLVSIVTAGGMPSAIVYFVGVTGASGRSVLGPVRKRVLGLTALSVPAAAVGVWIVLGRSASILDAAALTGVLTFFSTWQFLVNSILRGEGSVARINKQSGLPLIGYTGLIIIWAVARLPLRTWTLISLLAGSVAVGVLYGFVLARTPGRRRRTRGPVRGSDFWAYSRRSMFGSLGGAETLGLDVIVVAAILGPTETGYYAVARSAAALCLLAVSAIAGVVMGQLAGLQGTALVAYQRKVLVLSVALALLGVVMIALCAPFVIPTLFGAGFRSAVLPTQILVCAMGLAGIRRVLAVMALARGNAARTSIAELIGSIALIACLAGGGQAQGLAGASWGAVIGGLIGVGAVLTIARPLARDAIRGSWRTEARSN